MIAIFWSFRPQMGREMEFESLYGPEGAWVELFRTAGGYLGSHLFKDEGDPGRYLTVDCWASRQAYDDFRRTRLPEYEALDRRCESLTEKEESLGVFTEIPPGGSTVRSSTAFLPPRTGG